MNYSVPTRLAIASVALLLFACGRGASDGPDTVPEGAAETSQGDALMSQSAQERRIDYIEFLTTNVSESKEFYSGVFGWEFTDYGPDYTSFTDGRLNGGFSAAPAVAVGGPLIVLYTADLEGVEAQIRGHGGRIVRETFDFPGGRRFHFVDPAGNELAVWSDG